MVSASLSAVSERVAVLAFNPGNQLAVRTRNGLREPAFIADDLSTAAASLSDRFPAHTSPAEYFTAKTQRTDADQTSELRVYFTQVPAPTSSESDIEFVSLAQLEATPASLSPTLAAILAGIDPYLIEIPYLHLGENDFIYKFHTEKSRNRGIYQLDIRETADWAARVSAARSACKAVTARPEDATDSMPEATLA